MAPTPNGTSSPAIKELFHRLEAAFPSAALGDNKWYLVAISALTGVGKPNLAADLYLYLIEQPQYQSSEARQALMRRLREALVKCVSIVGVCRPLEAVFCIDAVTKDGDKDYSYSRCVKTSFVNFETMICVPI